MHSGRKPLRTFPGNAQFARWLWPDVPHVHARGARRDTNRTTITFFVAKTRASGIKCCFFTRLRWNVTVPAEAYKPVFRRL